MSNKQKELFIKIRAVCNRLHRDYMKKIRLSIHGRIENNLDFNPIMQMIYQSVSDGDFYDKQQFEKKINQCVNIASDIANHGLDLTKSDVENLKKTITEVYIQVCGTCIHAELMVTKPEEVETANDLREILINLLIKRNPKAENPQETADQLLQMSERIHQPEFSETLETQKETFKQLILDTFGKDANSEGLLNLLLDNEA